ncbi:MAG: hypothetical protein IIB40_02985 [Candidatus Marinimicrobia bacterium]|nr:hypothetical protein [Candidatus Neomarinimicrobiota bacterium]MCH7954924.1 hypothetical protein [Candidatus Neomarinimicrobiota bacterium]
MSANISVIDAQNCPDDILSNGKYFYKQNRYKDAIATFQSVTLMFPSSLAAEESTFMMAAAYKELADRQRNARWLSKAREKLGIYKSLYPEGRFVEDAKILSKKVEHIENQLTGMSKGLFIALTAVSVGSVLMLGVVLGL